MTQPTVKQIATLKEQVKNTLGLTSADMFAERALGVTYIGYNLPEGSARAAAVEDGNDAWTVDFTALKNALALQRLEAGRRK